MIVIIINESENKVLSIGRQSISKYLPQIGSGVWSGKISQEGLDALHRDVKKDANKNTSIICYRVSGYNKLLYFWHVGHKRYHHDGIFSYSQSSKLDSMKELKHFSEYHKLLRNMTKIAALLHDIGKNNICFRNKINPKVNSRNNPIKDALRHELISYLILDDLKNFISQEENCKKKLISDKMYLTYLQNEKIIKFFNEFVGISAFKSIKSIDDIADHAIKEDLFNYSPVWQFLKLLVLTHHRLPDKLDKKSTIKDDGEYFKKIYDLSWLYNKDCETTLKDCISIKNRKIFCSTNYIDQLTELAKNTVEIIKDKQDLSFLNYYIAYYCRPILIMSDYVGSSDAKSNKNLHFESDIIANTVNNEPGQDLVEHLSLVKKYTHNFYNQIYNWDCLLENIIYLSREEIASFVPIEEQVLNHNLKGKQFLWQQASINKILNTAQAPTFGVVIAGTGSGKTRAIPKIMSALDNRIRYTLCIGYRSLTLQTQEEYFNIGFKKKQIATLIGGSFSQEIFNATKDNTDGKENVADIDEDNIDYEVIYKNNNIDLDNLNKIYNKKERQTICAPIVIATIDHFIKRGIAESV